MIVWLNGTFGVGKTTTGNNIAAKSSNWRLFDPEHVGYLLAANLKDFEFDDFQELAPWRSLVPIVMEKVHAFTKTNLVAAQSVLVEQYWAELMAGTAETGLPVFHVVLHCDQAVLRERILADEVEGQAIDWRLDHLAKYEAARPWVTAAADLVIDTTDMMPEAVAAAVLSAVP